MCLHDTSPFILPNRTLLSETKDAQFRESGSLHRKTDSETSGAHNPEDNQRPLQTGVHRLPLEYLAEDAPHKADQRNAHQQNTGNIHHYGRQRGNRQYYICHREEGYQSCTTTDSHHYRSKQQRHKHDSKYKQYRTANNGEHYQAYL